jgi:hypothetical protein
MHSHVMNDHIMQSHTMHGHIMHAHAVHWKFCQNKQRHANCRDRKKNGLTAACQLSCFKFNTTAKVGMSLKINSIMPTTAKEWYIPLACRWTHWQRHANFLIKIPVFSYYLSLNSFMLITRWHLNKKLKMALPTHP